MDRPRFLAAARRSLVPGGRVAILQNNRDFARSPFLDAYESLLEELSPGYTRSYRAFDIAAELRVGLGAAEVARACWEQAMTRDQFAGMTRSSTQVQRALAAHGDVFGERLDGSSTPTAARSWSRTRASSSSGAWRRERGRAAAGARRRRAGDPRAAAGGYAPFAGRFAPTALGEDEQSIAPAAGSWLLAQAATSSSAACAATPRTARTRSAFSRCGRRGGGAGSPLRC